MGYRLSGPRIEHLRGPDIISDGTPFGAVQVAGDGVPIVLLADRGTAGGYTKIATVIGPDIPKLAQAVPGDTVTFESVGLDEAYQPSVCRKSAWPPSRRSGTPLTLRGSARWPPRSPPSSCRWTEWSAAFAIAAVRARGPRLAARGAVSQVRSGLRAGRQPSSRQPRPASALR